MAQNALGAGHGPHAPGDLDPELAHPDLAFGGVVVERDPRVGGEPQVVVLAGRAAGGPGRGACASAARRGRRSPACRSGRAEWYRCRAAASLAWSTWSRVPSIAREASARRFISRSASAAWVAQHHWPARGGVDDGLQFAQGVRVAQGVRDQVGRCHTAPSASCTAIPREGRQHPGGVHRLPAPPGVHGDQRVLARRRRVHPGQLAGDPEPGLVEVRHRRRRPAPARIASSAAAQRRGDPGDHAGDRARRDRDAEQLADRLAGAVAGQELPVPQVRARRGDPRPVLHRGAHPGRRRPRGDRAARAAAGDDPVLGHPRPDASGRSITWRRSVPVTGAPDRPAPQPQHRPGSCAITSSG